MKIHILILLILILSCCSAKKECNVPKTDTISKLFQVIENKMDTHYKYITINRLKFQTVGFV